MSALLTIFQAGTQLSKSSQALLADYMSRPSPYFDQRGKGLLPAETEVVHKTGTAGRYNGLTRATNDVGIITLPDGNHLVLSVFIADSYATRWTREQAMRRGVRAAYDYWVKGN